MQHDIIDNRERKLAASVKPLLSESEKAKFAVGYFFISGFKFIADELEKIDYEILCRSTLLITLTRLHCRELRL